MVKILFCLFKGHTLPSKQRKANIEYAYRMFGLDVWGSDAFSNMEKMDELEKEFNSCTRCGTKLTNQKLEV